MLRQLRLENQARYLWIDRVCINQSDGGERTAHVQIMHKIYKTAAKVIIWLGAEAFATADAFDVVVEGSKAISLASRPDGATPELSQVLEHGFPRPDDRRWIAFCILVLRPWFTRTWILQEVALAQSADLQWGSKTCPWHHMESVLLTALRGGYEKALYHLGENAHWANRVAIISGVRKSRAHVRLLGLISATPGPGVSDARDKVFALLGLADDRDDFRGIVDYNKSVVEIYTQVAAIYLEGRCEMSMLVLQLASDPAWNMERHLPSWVPDFTKGPIAISLTNLGYGDALVCRCPVPRVLRHGGILYIRGILQTTISTTGLRYPKRAVLTPDIVVFVYLEHWRKIGNKYAYAVPKEGRDEAFARTIAVMPNAAPVKPFEAFHEVYKNYKEQFKYHRAPTPQHENHQYAATFPYHHRVRQVCTERTFFITSNGSMGVGPWFARRGDIIVALHGAYTPFVLRESKGGAYQLVGEAYVHGMMDRPDCCDKQWQELRIV